LTFGSGLLFGHPVNTINTT